MTSFPRVYDDNTQSIGRTPLVRLHRVIDGARATVLAKIEGRNPAYSVKCRIGARHGLGRRAAGRARPGQGDRRGHQRQHRHRAGLRRRIEGHPVHVCMPETMSMERRKVLIALGAKLLLTPGPKGMNGAIAKAEELAASDPGRYVLMQQFENPANPAIHETTTGPEIWDDTGGNVDVLVSGVGTGGTITGVSRYFERGRGRALHSVAVEPVNSPVITQTLAGQPLTPSPHKIQGIGAGFVPKNLDLSFVDQVETVSNEESIAMSRRLASRGGHPLRRLLRRGHGRGEPAREGSQVGRKDHRGHPPGRRGAVPLGAPLRRNVLRGRGHEGLVRST